MFSLSVPRQRRCRTYSFLRQKTFQAIVGRTHAWLSKIGDLLLLMVVSLLGQGWCSTVARNSKQVHKEEFHFVELSLKLKEKLSCKDSRLCQGRQLLILSELLGKNSLRWRQHVLHAETEASRAVWPPHIFSVASQTMMEKNWPWAQNR
jgi:hypothetical protein